MRSYLLLLLIFSALPVVLVKPHIGILLWSWISYMNPHRLTWGFTQTFPFALLVGVTTIVSWLASSESKRMPLTPVTLLLSVFVLWMNVTTLFAHLPDLANEKWAEVMKILLISFVTLPLISTRERLNALVWVIVISVGFYGVKGGLWVLATGGEYAVYGPARSFIAANNALALALVMVLPLMRYLQLVTSSPWVRWGLAAAMILSLLSVISSYSRGAFLALCVMLFWLWLKSRNRLIIGIGMATGLVLGLLVMPEKWFDRIDSIGHYEEDPSAMSRIEMWNFALGIAGDSPMVGGGFDISAAVELYPRYGLTLTREKSPHSIYFEVLGEHGYVGLSLFLLIGIGSLITGTAVIRKSRNRPDLSWAANLAGMLQVSLIGYAVGGLFLNKAYFDLYYHLVVAMVITSLLAKKTTHAPEIARIEADTPRPVHAFAGNDGASDAVHREIRLRP